MPTLIAERNIEPWKRRLYLPCYTTTEAARYVNTSPQSIANWHYGESRTGVALPGKERGKDLSYLQLIEVAVVSEFRRLGIGFSKIKKARDYLKQLFDSEYPFAEYKFKTEGFHVLLDLKQFEEDYEFSLIVADKGGQLAWEPIMENRLQEFDYESNVALLWHLAGRRSQVLIDPRISFGSPSVFGIPTVTLKGRYQSGESIDDIQDDFDIPTEAIIDGLDFEGITIAA